MKITDLKVIYICPDHNEKYHTRKLYMDDLLRTIGFTDIIHYKSGTAKYPACLIDATINILKTYMNEPFLLLEDDVGYTGVVEFELPAEADAIYFGLSKYGGSKTLNLWDGFAKHGPYSATQSRVLNMLAAHAILYISPRYKQAVIDALLPYRDISYNSDVLMSRIQANFNVLALKKPAFYQSSMFNKENQEDATKITIA